jgi:hypothetical protein
MRALLPRVRIFPELQRAVNDDAAGRIRCCFSRPGNCLSVPRCIEVHGSSLQCTHSLHNSRRVTYKHDWYAAPDLSADPPFPRNGLQSMRHSAACALLAILTTQQIDWAAVHPKLLGNASVALREFVRWKATEPAQTTTALEAEAGEGRVLLVADGTADGCPEADDASPGQSPLCFKSPMLSLPSARHV